MSNKWFFGIFFSILLITLLFVGINSYLQTRSASDQVGLFFGVDAVFASVENTKLLIDEVKSYTNFFVIGSTAITWNATRLNEVCQYLNDSGLYFSMYIHPSLPEYNFSDAEWIREARQKWPSNFLGLYAYDEAGGYQIERSQYMVVKEADNYTDAADKFVANVGSWLNQFRYDWGVGDFPLVTSDYVLYDFDYKAGYDAVFAEFGWNHSRPLNVALCRGAASMQNKDWGAMITWTYDNPPYIESWQELYDDMVYAYQNGAKYILVFDYPENSTFGILTEHHFTAMKQFWQYVQDNPRTTNKVEDRVAYVLPKDYGFGFRMANDNIWGLWSADNQSSKIWSDTNSLLEQYTDRLDIIYEDHVGQKGALYEKLIFWNGTVLERG
jgi:hypothetical protein